VAVEQRILLVDDDSTIRLMYKSLLEAEGYTVVEENCAVEALNRLAKEEKFDLVITDIMMAKMDGWEFLKAIRNDVGLSSLELPVIVVSAHFSSDFLQAEAFKLGASSTYTKGEPVSRLLKEVKIHTGTMRSKFNDDTSTD